MPTTSSRIGRTHSYSNRLFELVLGRNNSQIVRRVARHSFQWCVYVLLAEIAALIQLRIVAFFGSQDSIIGICAIVIHEGIAIVGMLGFFFSLLLDGLEHAARRLKKIQRIIETR